MKTSRKTPHPGFVVRLGTAPSPFHPGERLESWIGEGARVQHVVLARVFATQAEARNAAQPWPEAEIITMEGKLIIRPEMVALLACRTPHEFMAWLGKSNQEQAQQMASWLSALCIPDDRCA